MSSLVDNDLGMDDYPSPVLPMHPSVSNFFADEAMNASEESPSILQKDSLTNPSADEFDMLVDHLRIRLREGQFECIYEVGTSDLDASVETLGRMAAEHNAEVSVLRRRLCPHAAQDNSQLYTADCLVRVNVEQRDFMEIRVAVVGNVDAGKSTLLGVLTHGELDNGRGYARLKLFRHKHEIESGRTSSVGNDILGFDAKGQVTNNPDPHGRQLDWVKICEDSSKVLTFIDLAGHEKYLKTTVFGMTGHLPDYCMLMIGANMGVVGMTKEHLGLALALNVPVFVVLTKIDMCPPNVLQDTIQLLQKILKSPGCRKLPVMVQNVDDVVVSATNFCSERICPIFEVSNVTGHHLELLRMFLNLLPLRSHLGVVDQPAEFQIDETYSVPGVGTVVSGTCLQGVIRLNDTLMLGPDSTGAFMSVPVKSIHRKRMPVRELRAGQTASFSLKKVKRSFIRKGMVMVAPTLQPKACWEFEGDILVLHHPTTISPKYQAMVHCGSIRQTATIINMSRDCLRTGDKATVKFRFIKNPEYIKTGQRLVFREGRTKAVGNITKLQPYVPVPGQQVQNRAVKRNKPNQAPSNSSDQASANRRRGGRRQREFSALKEMGDQTEAADTSEMKIDE